MTQLVERAVDFHVGAVPYPPVSLNHSLASPNKIFEYFMAGLCVVSTDLPVLRTLVDEAGAGRLIPPTAAGWQRGLAELAADRNFVEEASRRARAAAEAQWSWERQADTLLGVYERLGVK